MRSSIILIGKFNVCLCLSLVIMSCGVDNHHAAKQQLKLNDPATISAVSEPDIAEAFCARIGMTLGVDCFDERHIINSPHHDPQGAQYISSGFVVNFQEDSSPLEERTIAFKVTLKTHSSNSARAFLVRPDAEIPRILRWARGLWDDCSKFSFSRYNPMLLLGDCITRPFVPGEFIEITIEYYPNLEYGPELQVYRVPIVHDHFGNLPAHLCPRIANRGEIITCTHRYHL